MVKRKLTLDEQIEGERETVFWTSAPQAVKDEARKRLKLLLTQRDAQQTKVKPDAR